MAGGSMKDIKRRIKSVESTAQITKAMELVASSKLRKAKDCAQKAAPYFDLLYQTICEIAGTADEISSEYIKRKKVKNSLFVVIAGDRGLAGGYNTNVLKLADTEMQGKNAKVIAIGKKAVEHFEKTKNMISGYSGIAEDMDTLRARVIAEEIRRLYLDKEVDEVYICYTQFISPLSQVPYCIKLLPLSDISEGDTKGNSSVIEYEPDAEEVFETIVPYYMVGMVYSAIVESYASEQGARRTAMESANDNATEMINDLSLKYNRARQAAITQEISEIVGGASAEQS